MLKKNTQSSDKKAGGNSIFMRIKMYKFYQLMNDTAVFVYKLMGVPVLVVLMLWTLSYLSLTVFYLVSSRWIVPVIVGPTNEQVLRESSLYNSYLQSVKKLKDNKKQLASSLLKLKQTFASDMLEFNVALGSLLMDEQKTESEQQLLANSQRNEGRMKKERSEVLDKFRRRLIDTSQLQRELSQISKQERELASPNRHLKNKPLKKPIESIYDSQEREVLLGEISARPLSLNQARVVRDLLDLNHRINGSSQQEAELNLALAEVEKDMKYYEPLVAKLEASPFLNVTDKGVPMAFVPYQNKANLKSEARVYSCSLYFILCRDIGSVDLLLLGNEVTWDHPFFGTSIRGIMVKMSITDMSLIEKSVIMIGRPPLWL